MSPTPKEYANAIRGVLGYGYDHGKGTIVGTWAMKKQVPYEKTAKPYVRVRHVNGGSLVVEGRHPEDLAYALTALDAALYEPRDGGDAT